MNDYVMPQRMRQLQGRVRTQVGEFLERNAPEDSVLVLDSTGPTATRHYLILNAIGRERLLRFREIHAFSGGAFGIFGFLGITSNNVKLTFPLLRAHETERAFRGYHHEGVLSVPRAIVNLIRRKSVFASNKPVHAMLDHIFRSEYLQQPFSRFPANVVIHLGRKGTPPIVKLSNGEQCDEDCRHLRAAPLDDVIVSAVTVPLVYGKRDGEDAFFDAVYSGDYIPALKRTTASGRPTLVSTPWKSGRKENVTFINCFPSQRQKLEMAADFARLVLNLPNRGWGHDIYAAFES
jgi:hypothetical protein